ncbi:DUF393 domain-containing protein [Sphingomonas sp. So64.6b]|uniref:thiol-disulfide oxidoreductase DCC family protein n=1 Tax=Sphingomonas sp. So64.6b TaxID=2997354 RepID=UPI0016022C6A|nr:DCC1-like thiol-disulfide oxidoreductase family protein [Sphingomonas sp. So64.6b]QNA83696.1 DUF393 domain-containing protein [Sphingomonas sp. So64.6b]
MSDSTGSIIIFDAQCVLCSANAQFVLRHDRRRVFRLAPMQSAAGSALYRHHGIDPTNPETMIVVDGEHVLKDSEAVIAIYSGCGWPWRLAAIARAVPRPARDAAYRLIARNRYRLFGKRDTCWPPAIATGSYHRISLMPFVVPVAGLRQRALVAPPPRRQALLPALVAALRSVSL